MSTKIDNILNPMKVLNNIKDLLFNIYVEDYGINSREKINERWNNTIFVTDSLPFENKRFIDSNKGSINPVIVLRTYLEHKDFKRKQMIIDETIKSEFEEFISFKYQIFSSNKINELWKLKGTKEEYMEYGWDKVNEVLKEKFLLLSAKKRSLIKHTLWGMRMQQKYRELSVEQLSEILLQDEVPALTCVVENKKHEYKTVCQIPIVRYSSGLPSLDRMVLHELRHVVETEGTRSGLSLFPAVKYNVLNEIRTEENALEDEKRVPVLFSRESIIPQSAYDLLIPYLNELGDFRSILNKIAFEGDIDSNNDILYLLNNHLIRAENDRKEKINRIK